MSVKLEKRKNEIGFGIYTNAKISKGELLVDYSTGPGQMIGSEKAGELYDQGKDYMIQVDDDKWFAAVDEDEKEDADEVLHSCDPNCGIKDSLKLVALRNIKVNEEITFDYAMSESADYEMTCKCGSDNCRGVITGEDWKNEELQEKYEGFFSKYIEEKIDYNKNI